tara:strand:+ start:17501 stop:19744 length:2244 start_codon:yes stop_codon:yes gene_type:complete
MIKTILSIFIFCRVIFCQEYLWPVELKIIISSNFGETRPRRFHSGIDIKTNGSTGHSLFATSNGHVSRIKVSSDGYGKTLYLKLEDGNTAVYAHLEKFSPLIESMVRDEQKNLGTYKMDKYLLPDQIVFRKGEIMSYSGETGGAFGPHLHFELRDAENNPINPLSYGLTLQDNIPPVPDAIAIIPLSTDAVINGSPLTQIFPVMRNDQKSYEFPDTIHVSGTVGIDISAFDKITGSTHKYNFTTAELWVDTLKEYSITFDSFPFNQSHLIELERDNSLRRYNEGEYHRLFNLTNDPPLDMIDSKSNGMLQLDEGYHQITINLFDQAMNQSQIKGILYSSPPKSVTAKVLNVVDNSINISVFSKSSEDTLTGVICYKFNNFGFVEERINFTALTITDSGLTLEFKKENIMYSILQIAGVFKSGAVSQPFHLPVFVDGADYMVTDLDLTTRHLDNSVIFQVNSNDFITKLPDLILSGKNKYLMLKTSQVSPTSFLSEPISPDSLIGIDNATVSMHASPMRKTTFNLSGSLSSPDKTTFAISGDKQCSIQALPGTFYESTYYWIEHVETPVDVSGGTFYSDAYQLQPFDRPLQDTARVAIALDRSVTDISRMGIFYYDPKSEWTYLPSQYNEKKKMFFTTVFSLETMAVIQDQTNPVITDIFPGPGGSYFAKDVRTLFASINDELAGVKNEQDIELLLDGKTLLCEYQPINKYIRYILQEPLKKGGHNLIITVKDQVGNSAKKEISFSIL